MIQDNIDDFTRAYIECALWSSVDDNGDQMDSLYDISDISSSTLDRMTEDCERFVEEHGHMFLCDDAQAGHDFWLTRNGHGDGFWDRDDSYYTDKEALTEYAHAYGAFDLYVGDDGIVHGM